MAQPYSNLAQAYPNLSGTTAQASKNILSRLKGELSPETQQAIQNASAVYGITSGMPGSGLASYRTARDLGLATMDVQSEGLNDFLKSIGAFSDTIAPSAATNVRDRQFQQELGFRQGEANRAYGLNRNQADLELAEFNERYGPREYSTKYLGATPFGYKTPAPIYMTPGGRTATNPAALQFKYRF